MYPGCSPDIVSIVNEKEEQQEEGNPGELTSPTSCNEADKSKRGRLCEITSEVTNIIQNTHIWHHHSLRHYCYQPGQWN